MLSGILKLKTKRRYLKKRFANTVYPLVIAQVKERFVTAGNDANTRDAGMIQLTIGTQPARCNLFPLGGQLPQFNQHANGGRATRDINGMQGNSSGHRDAPSVLSFTLAGSSGDAIHWRARGRGRTLGRPRTRLYFGLAVVPRMHKATGTRSLGAEFHASLGFHRMYLRALLWDARRRMLKQAGSA